MKVLLNNKIYVQRKDIAFLIHIFPHISSKFPKQVLKRCFSKILICNDDNKYDFIEFDDIDSIKFFNNLSYIVNYYDYEGLSFEEIIRNVENIGNDINNLSDKYQELSEKVKKEKYSRFKYLIEIRFHKMNSIREVYKIKTGELNVNLPILEERKEEKSLKKHLNKLFNREK